MKIVFNGESQLIEANTLINSLIHFTNIVQEINKELSHDSKKVEVKIKALPEGSFIVDFVIQASDIFNQIRGLLTPSNMSYAADLVEVTFGIYAVAKWLKGKKPNRIENKDNVIVIENSNGEVNTFDFKGANIYLTNNYIREAISKSFETLESDSNVSGFELLNNNNEKILEIESAEFVELTQNDFTSEKTEKTLLENANMHIIALDLELKKKWDFYYNGHKISAKVKDPSYQEIINKGERFGKGDVLEVELEIKQEFNEDVNTFINKSYSIIKIKKHIVKPDQPTLF